MSEIINNVPGFEQAPDQSQPHQPQEAISIPEDEFRGDPSRVIGHPSNPNTEASAAYAEQLADQAGEVASATDDNAGNDENMITHVPSAEELQQKSL